MNDLHRWEAWSPWAKLDPAAKKSFDGPDAGKRAIFQWSSNTEMGEGTMTVTESHPNDLVRIALDFTRPMACTNQVEFTFKPAGDQTEVTWAMTGHKNFIQKAFCLFMNMDKMVGGMFEQGLAQMKTVVESPKKSSP